MSIDEGETLKLPKLKQKPRIYDVSDHCHCCDAEPNIIKLRSANQFNFSKPDVQQNLDQIHLALLRVLAAILIVERTWKIGIKFIMHCHQKMAKMLITEVYLAYHGGQETAHFTGNYLHKIIKETISRLNEEKEENTELNYVILLKTSYDLLEKSLLKLAVEIGCRDGTTGTTVLITNSDIYCANTGDSRAVLCRAGTAVALSRDHKPYEENERKRIIAAGGAIKRVLTKNSGFGCFPPTTVPQGMERLWPGGFNGRALGDIRVF